MYCRKSLSFLERDYQSIRRILGKIHFYNISVRTPDLGLFLVDSCRL